MGDGEPIVKPILGGLGFSKGGDEANTAIETRVSSGQLPREVPHKQGGKKMKRFGIAAVLTLVMSLALPGGVMAWGPTSVDYGDVTLNNWGKGNFAEIWNLTQCDLTLSYTIDMSGIATAGWAVTEVGLRQVGAPNVDPNLLGGWMQSNYIYGTSNPGSLSNNDFHFLSRHGWLCQEYDAEDADTVVAPYWSGLNYGFWFDRDGVDEWQDDMWGMIDGGTYNTGGTYDIVITYHAIDATTGTMFATINGVVQQGLYVGGWKNAQPEFYPAGRSFTGDMARMQVFYGRGGGGGSVTISDIIVEGCNACVDIDIKPGSDPNSINLKSKGVVPVAVLTTADFDAANVDATTVVFAGAEPDKWQMCDVDGDGDIDMLFHFKTQELVLDADSTEATLTGETLGDNPIVGTDNVNMVPKPKNK